MKRNPLVSVTLVVLGLSTAAMAADAPVKMPLKAPVNPPYYDWTGFYVGAHGGYATGYSKWSGTEPGAPFPTLSGSLDFFHAFDGFKGTGSYFVGLQAGYNYMLPSRVVLGAEADVTFPSNISGLQVISSPATGTASYAEQVQYSGTVRGRVGYAPSHWLVYVTGGFAWTANQFTRTQIDGTPVGGSAAPGDEDRRFVVARVGGAVGAGVEVALPSSWTARLEYLYTDYGSRSVYFPTGAQRFDFELEYAEHPVRLQLPAGRRPLDGRFLRQRAFRARLQQFQPARADHAADAIRAAVSLALCRHQ